MKKIIIIFLMPVMVCGCQTTKPADLVLKDYKTVIFDDGVSLEEAVIIAKKEVLGSTPPASYVIDHPMVVTNFENVPHHEEYWFVSFQELQKSSIPIVYMIAISKQTGKIVFSRSYSPENEWVLQAAFLKLYERSR